MAITELHQISIDELQNQFPEFEILDKVGEGAFKSVFKVRNQKDGQTLALKILSPNSFDAARLFRETQAMKAIQSPYIAKLVKFELEVSENRSVVYLLENFIEGQTLEDYEKHTKVMDLSFGLALLDKLLQALEACWAKKIVHRDIKPANIIIGTNNDPNIIDFGLSRHLEMTSLTPTVYSGILGTPMYAAPEILYYRKPDINGTTDLYSLGITFYEALTGIHPYLNESNALDDYEAAVQKMITAQAHPLYDINTSIPKKVSDFILRLIERQPIDRYRDAKQARERLSTLVTSLR